MKKEIFEKALKIEEHLNKISSEYYHTRVLIDTNTALTEDFSLDIKHSLRNILTVPLYLGAVTLMTAKTGVGKTHLSKHFGNLFGEDYVQKTCVNLGAEAFLDMDFSVLDPSGRLNALANAINVLHDLDPEDERIKEFSRRLFEALEHYNPETKLSQGIKPKQILKAPFVILNEPNQAHETLQAILIPFLDQDFTCEGYEGDSNVGVAFDSISGELFDEAKHDVKDKKYYRSVFMSINEGDGYLRNKIDRAIRDRAHFEIPLDYFRMTFDDVYNMLTKKYFDLSSNNGESDLEDILKINVAVRELPIDNIAQNFMAYLTGLDNCAKYGHKSNVDNFNPAVACQGCKFLTEQDSHMGDKAYNICPYITNPSPRSINVLEVISKGFAFLRGKKMLKSLHKIPEEQMSNYLIINGQDLEKDVKAQFAKYYTQNLSVDISDVCAAMPFVLYSKLDYDKNWSQDNEIINKFTVLRHIAEVAQKKFKSTYAAFYDELISRVKEKFDEYCSSKTFTGATSSVVEKLKSEFKIHDLIEFLDLEKDFARVYNEYMSKRNIDDMQLKFALANDVWFRSPEDNNVIYEDDETSAYMDWEE